MTSKTRPKLIDHNKQYHLILSAPSPKKTAKQKLDEVNHVLEQFKLKKASVSVPENTYAPNM